MVERFDTIDATVNADYLSLINGERFSTNGDTTEASYIGIIYEERYNSNGETTEENNDFFDDIVNSRLCGVMVQRTVTPRGGVNEQPPELPWLKLHPEKVQHRGSNTTTTMVAIIRTDSTASIDDHAWTDDLTTQRLQNNPISELPSDEIPDYFNNFSAVCKSKKNTKMRGSFSGPSRGQYLVQVRCVKKTQTWTRY